MEKIICNHPHNFEKINNIIYICKNCSSIKIVKEDKFKILLVKYNDYYSITNEINIFYIIKNAIKFYNNASFGLKLQNIEKNNILNYNFSLFFKFRTKLINHLYNLCSEINSTYECFYLSTALLDRIIILLSHTINNYQLDLYSTSCFIIAKKFVEKDKMKHENYSQYLTICHSPQKFINSKDLIIAEIDSLKILKYQLNIPTMLTIMKYLFICGIIFENEIEGNDYSHIYDDCLECLNFCNKQIEISLYYSPVLIVFSIIYLIRKKAKLKFSSSMNLFSLFDIKFCDIKECVKIISKFYFNNNNNSNEKKYNDKTFKKSLSQLKLNNALKNYSNFKFKTPNKYSNIKLKKTFSKIRVKCQNKENNFIQNDARFFRDSQRKSEFFDINIKNPFSPFIIFDYQFNIISS